MELYKTISDFPDSSMFMGLIQSIAVSAPGFFPMALFLFWLLGSGASYFSILKTTGKKRFWQVITSMSFVFMVVALLMASMNSPLAIILDGYWVGFYMLMTLGSWYALSQYK